jgi:hypothetical protein
MQDRTCSFVLLISGNAQIAAMFGNLRFPYFFKERDLDQDLLRCPLIFSAFIRACEARDGRNGRKRNFVKTKAHDGPQWLPVGWRVRFGYARIGKARMINAIKSALQIDL